MKRKSDVGASNAAKGEASELKHSCKAFILETPRGEAFNDLTKRP